ncbi:MAG: NADH-quinone oxidoreductase subunit L [Deltaproteobacteria bacterium]|nr:NADH-quinone oxidoreductase subunit L [Deltaproteobacteria bacterium]
MVEFDTLYLIPFLPLLGAAIVGLFGSRMDRGLVTTVALASVFGSFLVTCVATYTIVTRGAALENVLWVWMDLGRYRIDLAFGLDRLSATLLLVVTGVGFLIHVYSTGYMKDDPGYWRYFAYLNFFIFAMSVLVIGRSLPVMFIGWEGVGLASYLLIGFWYSDEAKARAGRKAFIVNRIGDFGFLIGIFVLLGLFGTVDFVDLEGALKVVGPGSQVIPSGIFAGWTVSTVLNLAAISLFVGACGKSAQFPLYVWLPDAMAGPTPVSALIHAATMVTAGVFMVARMHSLYDQAPAAANVVAYVGAFTAVFAASIGLAQNDIKKVLAYSTVSQLGYMFLAVGVGAYAAGMFHLVTHAFFKACLFLGSGAVIHALHGEQDMRRMGGLAKLLPSTYWTFAVSTLALAGVVPFSGFWSKDLILGHALGRNLSLFLLGLFGAGLTAFYMSRLMSLTFYGEHRNPDPHAKDHLHHPDRAMSGVLVVLAGLATIGGALCLPHFFGHTLGGFLEHWLAPSVGERPLEMPLGKEVVLMGASTTVAFLGLLLGFTLYRRGPAAPPERGGFALIYNLVANKWYVDEIYEATLVRLSRAAGSLAAMIVDPWVIDGILVRLIPGVVIKGSGSVLRRPQNGNVQAYATLFVVAAALLTGWAVW